MFLRTFLYAAVAATLPATLWQLPRLEPASHKLQRSYRLTLDYLYAQTDGQITRRERVVGDYTQGLPAGSAEWHNVSVAKADGQAPFKTAEPQTFMEGFRYRLAPGTDTTQPAFFAKFPADAIQARNLVWDTQMFKSSPKATHPR